MLRMINASAERVSDYLERVKKSIIPPGASWKMFSGITRGSVQDTTIVKRQQYLVEIILSTPMPQAT